MENQEVESPNGRILPELWVKWPKCRAKKGTVGMQTKAEVLLHCKKT